MPDHTHGLHIYLASGYPLPPVNIYIRFQSLDCADLNLKIEELY